MEKCPYCGVDNLDGEIFCEECGRLLKKPEKKKKIQSKYAVDDFGNISYISPTQIIVRNDCEEFLMFPDLQSLKNEKWELVFKKVSGKNLAEYLSEDSSQKVQRFIEVESRILAIFEKVQSKKYIIGSCDMEDFFLIDSDLNKMVLRVVRPLITNGKIPEDYLMGEFAAPEVKNQDLEYIGSRTDVYLAAIIFNRLIIGSMYSEGNIDAQLFWGYTLTNGAFSEEGKRVRRFHQWLGDTLNMYPTKRKRKIKDARLAFEKCCQLEVSRINRGILIEDVLQTNIGKGKKELMVTADREESEWNEDAIEKWEKVIYGEIIKAYLLADGISNCDVGTGYLASNIIRENFKAVLDELVDNSFDDVSYDMVENLAYEIVRRSNRDIWIKACEYSSQNGSIMGSTFIFIFIIGGGMYTYCLGDSPLYLIRKETAIPLYSPDSAGFEALKRGMSYSEYRQMEGKDSIALYVGGEYARTESEYYKQRKVDVMTLQENDIIVAASDGVLDYMGSKLSDTDWDKEIALVNMLTKQEPLDMRAAHIIKKDNTNGGGDNLSIILIKAGTGGL